MSLKNVELQVALPRTVENSRNQQLMQHQNSLQNAQASEELAAKALKSEQTVMESDESARAAMRDRQGKGMQQQADSRHGSAEEQGEAEPPHPYKGQRLDIKL